MSHDLKPGSRVMYQGRIGHIEELARHDSAVIQLDGIDGVMEVQRSALIPVVTSADALGDTSLTKIEAGVWEMARTRAKAIREVADLRKGRSRAVEVAARKLDISPRQVWRLLTDYLRHRTVSEMARRVGGRALGTTVLDTEVERIIANRIDSDYLQRERSTVQALHELVAADCRAVGKKPPAKATVKKRVDAIMGRDAMRRREGAKRAKYAFEPMPGHVEAVRPLERVEIDHTPMDVFARSDDPLCTYIGRPWLTVVIDVCTRCVLGIHIGFEPPSILSVSLCLTHAVSRKNPAEEFGVPLDWPMHGVPKEIWVDNGRDFQSMAFQRGCEEHGIQLSYRPVGSPHYGGTIERLIGTMVGQCHLLPGTTKNSVKAKGDYDPQKHATFTLSEVRRWFVDQLLGRYHLREHRMLRIPPQVAWDQAMKAQQEGE
ncbi:DDE-type integrase/transposase/recombinase [Marilutibacter chinensis]|uniref:DDE-type integrase/transposase/recombinase n=1 Tax=Marilutibacter chinensis TaxID=2912247 RepID=A0ABS9HRN4_9GAMM|nr:DDE-type integrase/transposase/recombinase [Lysobacter chinensis]MCF7221601.1 DDE-type integrase/transposase/recombinase [Lysobacter chinensis]